MKTLAKKHEISVLTVFFLSACPPNCFKLYFIPFFYASNLIFPVLPHSEPSSCSPSPALSTDSLSSSSDHSSSHILKSGRGGSDQLPVFTKSVSEPSICSPCSPASSSSSEHLPQASQSLYPPPTSSSATSAPATPQTGRSSGAGAPSVSPSPLDSGGTQTHKKVGLPSKTALKTE